MQGIKLEIDGREHWFPADLDLNEAEEFHSQEFGDGQLGWVRTVKYLAWIVIRRDNPEATLEDAGKKFKYDVLMDDEVVEEEPPAIPLPEPDPLSGTSSDESNGNGSTGINAVTEIHGAAGLR